MHKHETNIMKKIFIIAILALGVSFAAAAQPRAVGGRLGYGIEASYQHTLGSENFIEADLGFFTFNSVNAAATYNFMILHPQWTPKGEWGVYAGPGLGMGVGFNGYFNMGVGGQVGLEYTFDNIPLQLSVDYRPMFGMVAHQGQAGFYIPGVYNFGIGARYCF